MHLLFLMIGYFSPLSLWSSKLPQLLGASTLFFFGDFLWPPLKLNPKIHIWSWTFIVLKVIYLQRPIPPSPAPSPQPQPQLSSNKAILNRYPWLQSIDRGLPWHVLVYCLSTAQSSQFPYSDRLPMRAAASFLSWGGMWHIACAQQTFTYKQNTFSFRALYFNIPSAVL